VLDLRAGTDVDSWVKAHQGALGPTVTLDKLTSGPSIVRALPRQLSTNLLALGLVMVLIGAYLAYLTIATRVVERVRLYGTLQALGATRRQVRRLVVTEAAVLGVVSSILGLLLGLGIAAALLSGLHRQLVEIGGARLVVSPTTIAAGLVIGTLATVIAALVPARRAARLDPVAAMRETHSTEVRPPRHWLWGALPAFAGVGLLYSSHSAASQLGNLLLIAGVLMLLPGLMGPLARLARPIAAQFAGISGVAINHVVTERRRSGRTLGLITVVLALILTVGALYVSVVRTDDRLVATEERADLTLTAPATLPPDFVTAVRRLPGVALVTTRTESLAKVQGPHGEVDAVVGLIDPADYFDVNGLVWAHGNTADARAALLAGDVVLAPGAAEKKLGMRPGTTVTLRTVNGPHAFRVAATYESANTALTLHMSSADGERYLGAGQPTELDVKLDPGRDPAAEAANLRTQLGGRSTFLIATRADVRRDIRSQVAAFISPFLILLGIASLIGVVGLANTLAMSIIERYRELGILRALGTRRRQIRLLVFVESAILVLIALVLAVPLGIIMSVPLASLSTNSGLFETIHYHFPTVFLPVVAVVALVTAAGAAVWPAHHAATLDIDTALRFE
jgi:putative ABC transport system permease protein